MRGINQDHINQTGCDLTQFLPARRLQLGDELILDPPRVKDRFLKKGVACLLLRVVKRRGAAG